MPDPVTFTGQNLLELLEKISETIQLPFLETINEIMEEGKQIMRQHVADTIKESKSAGDKTFGVLVDSIDSVIRNISVSDSGRVSATIEIGSTAPHGGFASRQIGATAMNRVVFIKSTSGDVKGKRGDIGRYRFIGMRPPIPGHPFLEISMESIPQLLLEKYQGKLTEAFASNMRGNEEQWRAGMLGLFG